MRRNRSGTTVGAVLGGIVGVAVQACSSGSSQPAMIGDCTPIGDAGCSVRGPGGGSGGPGDGGATGSDASTDAGVGGCGSIIIATQNTTCAPCIESSCCGANAACSGQPACSSLVACTLACASSDEGCITTCFNTWPTAQTAYDDLSGCSLNNCPGCPSLPEEGIADF